MTKITSRLVFRITVPIILIWLALSVLLYHFVQSAASEFWRSNIQDDMTWLSRQAISICNEKLDKIIMAGQAANPVYVKINQNRAILAMEDIMRQFSVDGYIRTDNGDILFATGQIAKEKQKLLELSTQNPFGTLKIQNQLFYASFAHFAPWGWNVTLLKSFETYVAFQKRMARVYVATGGALSAAVIIIILILYRSVNVPIGRIIHNLNRGEKPDYKGVFEAEYLSQIIADMMTSLEQLNQNLEDRVQERTRELAEAKEGAEAASAAKTEFLARMSHEIRTPLNAVTGLTQVVLKSDLSTEQRDYLNKVRIASTNLLEVINDILDFSKIEAGHLELAEELFNLDEVLEKMADLFSNEMAQKNLELLFSIDPEVPRQLKGDAGHLTQILTNLIGNAIKFTNQGEIMVKVGLAGPMEEAKGHLHLKFRIKDTGVGIPHDIQASLFDPFTQAEGYLTRQHEGTGLGLAICRQLVERMGGTISVESIPGEGSTFSFTILVVALKEGAPRVKTKSKSSLVKIAGRRVLVVEDSELNRDVAVAFLKDTGLIVQTAENGQVAVNMVKDPSNRYDAVLMDIQMPVMDGYEATRQIRQWEQQNQKQTDNHQPETRLPIIALTAHALKSEREKCLKAGIDDYLTKPMDEQNLHQILIKWIRPQNKNLKPVDSLPIVSKATLDIQGALKRLGGRRKIFFKALKRFAPEYADAAATICKSLDAGKIEQAIRTAHSTKGTAATVGAMALSEVAATLEKALKKDGESVEALITEFEQTMDATLVAIAEVLKGDVKV